MPDATDAVQSRSKTPVACPMGIGMAHHLKPVGDENAIITKSTSDALFGADGLGLGRTFWTTIISYLARNGIQEQTGSQPDETDIDNCVLGWGQGPYSSRVFSSTDGVDSDQLEKLLKHLGCIASENKTKNHRITAGVLASFVETQTPKPYSTWNGQREASGRKAKLAARFRGHIQWQGLIELCGQVDNDGVVHVSPQMLRAFFAGEAPFFSDVIEHRRALQAPTRNLGDASEFLSTAPAYVDHTLTDQRYMKNKSGLWFLIKILGHMLRKNKSSIGSL